MSRTKMIILDLLPQKRQLIEIRESFVSVVCKTNFHLENTIKFNVVVNANEWDSQPIISRKVSIRLLSWPSK
jgi:hypothetical protein